MRKLKLFLALLTSLACGLPSLLEIDDYKHYIDAFNANDEELHPTWITNAQSWEFLKHNIPLVDLPDKRMEQTYYFRWWTYRKHIKRVFPGGAKWQFVITEFLSSVKWAGTHNTIPCAAAHHIREGRWLHNSSYISSYLRFWTAADGGNPRQYSFWIADSVRAFALVNGKAGATLALELLPRLITHYERAIFTNFDESVGLFFNTDNRDGMELSIGGDGGARAFRPTLNSYQYGDAIAISKIAASGAPASRYSKIAIRFRALASRLKDRVETLLWDQSERFFKILSYKPPRTHSRVKELIGYTPWYFHLPSGKLSGTLAAWLDFSNSTGFSAPYGLTTAIQRDPHFSTSYSWLSQRGAHECQWNGPVWPYATSITLTALGNLLNTETGSRQGYVTKGDYFRALQRYAYSHSRRTGADVVMARASLFRNGTDLESSLGQSGKSSPALHVPASASPPAQIQSSRRIATARDNATRSGMAGAAHKVEAAATLRLKATQKVQRSQTSESRRLTATTASASATASNTHDTHRLPPTIPWIDENLHPYSGDWIARTVLRQADWPAEKGGRERGKDYNHSTFIDLLLTGLLGLRPRRGDQLDINPLVPITAGWAYFCVDRVKYHEHWIRVVWDASGKRYGLGKGLMVFVDGDKVAHTPTLQRIKVVLSE